MLRAPPRTWFRIGLPGRKKGEMSAMPGRGPLAFPFGFDPDTGRRLTVRH